MGRLQVRRSTGTPVSAPPNPTAYKLGVLFDRAHCPVKPWTPGDEREAWADMHEQRYNEGTRDRVRGGYNEARLYRGFNLLDRKEDRW